MGRGFLVAVMALSVALTATGCAGKLKISSATMCQANGGTYNASARTCTYPASTRSAQQTCEAHGGWYESAVDFCHIGLD